MIGADKKATAITVAFKELFSKVAPTEVGTANCFLVKAAEAAQLVSETRRQCMLVPRVAQQATHCESLDGMLCFGSTVLDAPEHLRMSLKRQSRLL